MRRYLPTRIPGCRFNSRRADGAMQVRGPWQFIAMIPRSASIRLPSTLKSGGRSRSGVFRKKRKKAIPHAGQSFSPRSNAAGARPSSLRSKDRLNSIPCCLTGTFVPPDAIQYRFNSRWRAFRRNHCSGRASLGKALRATVGSRLPKSQNVRGQDRHELFPPSEYVGQVKCLGGVSVDGRDHDWYEYDFYRDSESARTFYSHRSMSWRKQPGFPSEP